MASTRLCFASSGSGRRWPAPYGVRLHRRSSRQQRSAATPKTWRRPSTSAAWKVSRTSTSTPVWVRPLSFGSGSAMRRLSFEIVDDGVGYDVESARHAGQGLANMSDRIAALGGSPPGRVDAGTGYHGPGEHPGRRRRHAASWSRRALRLRRSQRLTSSRSGQGRADVGRGRPTTVGAGRVRSPPS